MKKDSRPKQYRYYLQLMDHLENDESKFFNDEFIWPRQFEIHLPADHKKACNLNCPHCAGKLFDKSLGTWEMEGLELLDNLKGAIPYHIYGGAYTEPLLNPYYLTFLHMTKKHGNHFGIHTNATILNTLETNLGWLTELNRISTDDVDYLSISLDAGFSWSWAKTKGTKKFHLYHNEIIEGVRKACEIRRKNNDKGHAIRLCYLISPISGNKENFESIVAIAKDLGVDSLRFSIPFGTYNQSFDKIRNYKNEIELPGDIKYRNLLENLVSKNKNEKPYIFYTGPEFTDIDGFDFKHCLYGYYQITYGADGYIYKCSTTATPTAKQCRLGKITSDVEEFKKIIMKNYNPRWDCQKMCFSRGVRCNRMGWEINRGYQNLMDRSK